MEAYKIIEDILLKESIQPLSGGKKGVIVCDLDDTLLVAQNIFIHKLLPDGKVIKLTPDEYAKDPDKKNKTSGIKYSYEEFRDPEKVKNSIVTGLPIIKNLRIMDAYINSGYDFSILTARGLEDIISKSLKKFLMFRNSEGELKAIEEIMKRQLIFAINDETKVYSGVTDYEKKSEILKSLSKKYDKVVFIDDDKANIEAAKKLNIPNISVIQAWGKE